MSNWKLISSQVRHDERAFGEVGLAEELEDGLQVLSPGDDVPQLDHQPRDQHPLLAQPRQHQDHVQVKGGKVQEELCEVRCPVAIYTGTQVSFNIYGLHTYSMYINIFYVIYESLGLN